MPDKGMQFLLVILLICSVQVDSLARSFGRIVHRLGTKSSALNVLPFSQEPRISQVEDDGYSQRFGSHLGFRARIKRLFRRLIRKPQPGTLIMIRHGETFWNNNSTFTGWVDVDLNERGRREMEHAARLLLERGQTIDIVYTSRLKRAIRSAWILLRELNQIFCPVYKSYRLNERMYGALEGLSKVDLAQQLGKEAVQQWRLGLTGRPPPMTSDHPWWHRHERKYADLKPDEIPVTESLQDSMDRSLPLIKSRIIPSLAEGRNILIVAHGNSIRGIVKHLDNLTSDEIMTVGIPNGIPLIYKFDEDMKPIPLPNREGHLSGEFLEKKGLLRAALAREAELAEYIPGYDMPAVNMTGFERVISYSPPLDPYLRSLVTLEKERRLYDLLQVVSDNENAQSQKQTGSNSSISQQIKPVKHHSKVPIVLPTRPEDARINATLALSSNDGKAKKSSIEGPVIVIIRHGKTEHNKLGLFTGWEDAPLAPEGRQEAVEAGRLLRAHGIQFDIVYTSWLSRAIETAWLVLNELDELWLPIIKSWRLNERMYGALTGLSKQMIGQRHGEKQLKLWRRSYATQPPKVSSFSSFYPGNDQRYLKYVKDVRISFFETLIRSLSHGRFELHRNFPKTESLKDCMDRTIPYFKEVIYPRSIAQGKNVLIASSENAIRGLLMHLCNIPPEKINEVDIPTGLPLVFDLKHRCIRLLDEGTGEDPVKKYDFGSNPDILFRPCDAVAPEDVTDSTRAADDSDFGQEGNFCYVTEDGNILAYDPVIRLQTEATTPLWSPVS